MTTSRARSHPMTELSSFHFQSSILCSFLFFQNPHSASLEHLQKIHDTICHDIAHDFDFKSSIAFSLPAWEKGVSWSREIKEWIYLEYSKSFYLVDLSNMSLTASINLAPCCWGQRSELIFHIWISFLIIENQYGQTAITEQCLVRTICFIKSNCNSR